MKFAPWQRSPLPIDEAAAVATAHMPDEFYEIVAHHLPPEQPVGPRGGRPRVVMRVIWFVLATGNRWEDVPHELGCSGRTAHRRLRAWEEVGIWDRLHADLLRLLRQVDELDTDLVVVDSVYVRAFGGGEQTGPSPVDRRKKGTKHTLLVSRSGVPLAIRTAGANASDHTQIIPIVLDFPRVGGKRGRPKELPDEVYADGGTTARRPGGCSGGWAASRTSGSGAPRTGAGSAGCGVRAEIVAVAADGDEVGVAVGAEPRLGGAGHEKTLRCGDGEPSRRPKGIIPYRDSVPAGSGPTSGEVFPCVFPSGQSRG